MKFRKRELFLYFFGGAFLSKLTSLNDTQGSGAAETETLDAVQ
jgi:hypothetical protein